MYVQSIIADEIYAMRTTLAHPAHRGVSGDSSSSAPAWIDKKAFPFRSRYFEISPGLRVHYVDEGVGDVLLFVHGTPSWSFEWRHAIAELSRTHRCVALDHVGFGLSDRPLNFDYRPESHARVLQSFIEQLDLRDITLVLHDFGGPIGLPLCFSSPERVKRLVVMNTWMWSFADDPKMTRNAKLIGGPLGRFLYKHANLSLRVIMPGAFADRRKLTPELHKQYLAPFPNAEARGRVLYPLAQALLSSSSHYEALWRQRDALRGIPALIVWGMKDPAFPPAMLDRWRSVLPQARVVELPVGHWPQEEAPDDVVRVLKEFATTA
jgi:pimeloyl-ACP methyl ester carboxylesterase